MVFLRYQIIEFILNFFYKGYFGIHRLYLDDVTMFIVYIVCIFLTAGVVSFVIWIYDLFAIPSLVQQANFKQM